MGVGPSTPQKLCLFQTVVCVWFQQKHFGRESLRMEGEVERREKREGKEGERAVLGTFTGTWYRSEPNRKLELNVGLQKGPWPWVSTAGDPGQWEYEKMRVLPSLGLVTQSRWLSFLTPWALWGRGLDSLRPGLVALVSSVCVFCRTPGFVPSFSSFMYLFTYLEVQKLNLGLHTHYANGLPLNRIPPPSFYFQKKKRHF